jgi:hypothetical protein
MSALHTDQFLPYPELVEQEAGEKPYTIMDSLAVEGLPSTGMVSKEERLMFVPLAESGASTIRHELAHVRWSPTKLPRVSYDPCILLAVEDARINIALERLGLGVHLSADLIKRVVCLAAADLGRGDIAAFALRTIASLGTNALGHVLAVLDPGSPGAGELVRMLLAGVQAMLERSRSLAADKSIATFAGAMKAARFVARELESRGLKILPDGTLRITLVEGGCCLSCAPSAHSAFGRLLRLASRKAGGKSGVEDINAAEMIISEPTLPVTCKVAPRASSLRARREGSLIRNPNRWFSDRAIFRGRARFSGGGTVLIDVSSSMKLDAAGVDRILHKAPSATLIAIYSGNDGKGELRIVARGGRRVGASGLIPFGPGNLIDLPALNWLAKQAAPRLWLSDGRVTGVHDWASSLLTRQCEGVCRRFAIRRVESAEEAAVLLDGRRLPVRPILP